jgi:type VI protein secretion system component Hcp
MSRALRSVFACALAAASLPTAAEAAPFLYSTHVAYRGSDGHRYSGDAIVYPKSLFPAVRRAYGFRPPELPATRSLGGGPFRFSSVFEAGRAFEVARPAASGALEFLLFVPGIYGTSTVPGHTRWSDLSSFTLGYQRKAGGKVMESDLQVVKQLDSSSPLLWNDVNSGRLVDQSPNLVTLQVVQPSPTGGNGTLYMSLTFTDSIVDGYALGASVASSQENISIAFRKVTICVYPQTANGSPAPSQCVTYDAALNNTNAK